MNLWWYLLIANIQRCTTYFWLLMEKNKLVNFWIIGISQHFDLRISAQNDTMPWLMVYHDICPVCYDWYIPPLLNLISSKLAGDSIVQVCFSLLVANLLNAFVFPECRISCALLQGIMHVTEANTGAKICNWNLTFTNPCKDLTFR